MVSLLKTVSGGMLMEDIESQVVDLDYKSCGDVCRETFQDILIELFCLAMCGGIIFLIIWHV